MNTEYCIECGHKAEFSLKRPAFCPGCGKPFNRASVATASKEEVAVNEEENLSYSKARLKDAYEVDFDGFAERVTFGDLFSAAAPRQERQPRPDRTGLEGKDLLNKIRQDCSSVRDTKSIGE